MGVDKFKVGDVVMLNSGGPLLTVAALTEKDDGDTIVGCGWFTREGEIRTGEFAPALLRAVKLPESSLH